MSMIQFVNNLDDSLDQGDVVVIGKNQVLHSYGAASGLIIPEVDLTQIAYDTRVCGVVSSVYVELQATVIEEEKPKSKTKSTQLKSAKVPAKKGALTALAVTLDELGEMDHHTIESGQMGWLIAAGISTACKVDADIAPIKAGDLLTTSPTKGHAQKAIDPSKATGAIIGKALGSLKKGRGKIPVLVMLQ
jgi:hypothetical protein